MRFLSTWSSSLADMKRLKKPLYRTELSWPDADLTGGNSGGRGVWRGDDLWQESTIWALGALGPKVVLILLTRLSNEQESSQRFHVLAWCSPFMLCHCVAFSFHHIETLHVFSCKLLPNPLFHILYLCSWLFLPLSEPSAGPHQTAPWFFRWVLHSVNVIWILVLPTGELISSPTFLCRFDNLILFHYKFTSKRCSVIWERSEGAQVSTHEF